MNQDQVIRFLMDNIDADALAEANRNGSTIVYFAGVAQRFVNIQNNVANPRGRVNVARPAAQAVPQPAEEHVEQERQVNREVNAVDLNENRQADRPAARPARRPARQANANADRVQVGNY